MSALTPAQQQALALDKNISVTAGAGSGKTRILVERFLKIVLQEPQRTRRILALTFTNKAAGEMQERIAGEIQKRLTETVDEKEKAKLRLIRDQLNSAAVSTIHSFCARLLREFPLQAGLAPDFSELDEIGGTIMMHRAVQQALHSLNDDTEHDWSLLFLSLNRSRIVHMLLEALKNGYDMQKVIARWRQFDEDGYLNYLTEQWLERLRPLIAGLNIKAFYDQTQQTLAALPAGWQMEHEKGLTTLNRLHAFQAAYQRQPDGLQALQEALRLIVHMTTKDGFAYKNVGQLGTNKSWPPAAREQLVQLSNVSAAFAEALLERGLVEGPGEDDRRWFRIFSLFALLYERAARIFRIMKQEEGALDFEDLQLLTLQLLEQQPGIRHELAKRFSYIMVDEFQDTDELQWRIIKMLATDDQRQFHGSKVFVVGDPKQSIYGFRNADIRIFNQVKKEFAVQAGIDAPGDYDGNVVFTESFRFLPQVNAFVNTVFQHVLQEDAGNPFEVGYHSLQTKRDLPSDAGWINLALLEEEPEADYMGWQIEQLLQSGAEIYEYTPAGEEARPLTYGDIAVLLRTRNKLLDVEQALRNRGVPFKTAKGVGFWQRQEIFDLYHLLRFLDNPQDDFALVAVLRSKFFLLSDETLFLLSREEGTHYLQKISRAASQKTGKYTTEERQALQDVHQQLKQWRLLREHVNLQELLEEIMQRSRFLTLLAAELNGEQAVANVKKLVEQAQMFEISGAGGLNDFLKYVTDLIEREMREGEAQINLEDRSSVKIMTIHAAKGLQFPVVFLPYLNPKGSNQRGGIYLDGEMGMAAKYEAPDNREAEHLLLRLLKERQRRKEIAEAKRLFYVGVTRASNYLFLSAQIKNGKEPSKNVLLAWLHQAFLTQGTDILTAESVQNEDFQMEIRRSFPQGGAQDQDLPVFLNKLNSFAEMLTRPLPEQVVPDYLLPPQAQPGAQIFSATRIMTYLENPQEYYRKYHLGFFQDDYEAYGEAVYPGGDALLWGKFVHRYLQRRTEQDIPDDVLTEALFFEFDVLDPQLQNKFRRNIQLVRERMKPTSKGHEIIFAEQALNEQSVLMRLGEDYFTGTLDRLFVNNAGLWEVADYKTNRIAPGSVQREVKKYDWQIKSYALLLSKLFPGQPEFPVSFYFLSPDAIHRQIFTAEDVTRFESFLIDTIREIKEKY